MATTFVIEEFIVQLIYAFFRYSVSFLTFNFTQKTK